MSRRTATDLRTEIRNRLDLCDQKQIDDLSVEISEVKVYFEVVSDNQSNCSDRMLTTGDYCTDKRSYTAIVSPDRFELYRVSSADSRDDCWFQPILSGSVNNSDYISRVLDTVDDFEAALSDDLNIILIEAQQSLTELIEQNSQKHTLERWRRDTERVVEHGGAIFGNMSMWIASEIATALVMRIMLGAVINTVPEYQTITPFQPDNNSRGMTHREYVDALHTARLTVERNSSGRTDRLVEVLAEIDGIEAGIRPLVQTLFSEEVQIYSLSGSLLIESLLTLIPERSRTRMGGYTNDGRGSRLCSEYLQRVLPTTSNTELDILDPACGDGGTLATLARHAKSSDALSLRSLTGIDLDPLATELTRARLVFENLDDAPHNLSIHTRPFQSVSPIEETQQRTLDEPHPVRETLSIRSTDAVIMQPPVLRAGTFDSQRWRETVEAEFDIKSSRRWDIAAYFLVHATAFLDDGAHLAAVVPDTLLSRANYDRIRAFLLDEFDIDGIVHIDSKFAHIPTGVAVLLLRKIKSRKKQPSDIPFATIQRSGAGDMAAVSSILDDFSSESDHEALNLCRSISRQEVSPQESWMQYLHAPSAYLDWKAHIDTTLSDIADISYGLKTGRNEFFFVDEEWQERLPDRHLSPTIRRQPDGTILQSSAIETEPILNISEELRERLYTVAESWNGPAELQDTTTELLSSCGADDQLIKYILQAEDRGINRGYSLQARKFWFLLPEAQPADAIVPLFPSVPAAVIWNDAQHLCTNSFLQMSITPKGEFSERNISGKFLAALLNTTPCRTGLYISGDIQQKNPRINTKLLSELPIPDIEQFEEQDREVLTDAFEKLTENPMDLQEQVALDEALLDTLKMDLELARLRELTWEQVLRR